MTTSTSYSQPKFYTKSEMIKRTDCDGVNCLLCDFWKDSFAQTVVRKEDCFNGSVRRYIADKQFVEINSANMKKMIDKDMIAIANVLDKHYP